MPRPLVVHVVSAGEDRVAWAELGRTGETRHAVGRPDPNADIVVLHGRRAALRGVTLRRGRCLVLHRPAPGARPGRAERRFLPWCDLVVARDEATAEAFRAIIERPPAAVVVLADDDPSGWDALVRSTVDPEAATLTLADPGPLAPSMHVRLEPVATRPVRDELLVATTDPTRGIERLTGSAPAIWAHLADGRSIAETAARVAPPGADEQTAAIVRDDVAALARHLIRLGLAVAQ